MPALRMMRLCKVSAAVRAAAATIVLLATAAPLAAQERAMTLEQVIDAALEQGAGGLGANADYDAARHRSRAFSASLLPRLSLSATTPSYNRSIIEVLQPDGTSLFRSQNLTTSALTATISQPLPFTGGEFFVSSSLSRLSVSGAEEQLSWQSTPMLVGLRQPLFRPNLLGWDRREQEHVDESARRRYLEAREDIAMQATERFFAVYAAEARLRNAVANAAVNDTLYRLNTGRYDIGSIGENDLLQSELALLRARADVDGASLDLERAHAELRLAVGLPQGTPIAIVIPDSTPEFEVDTALAVAHALRNTSTISETALQQVRADRQVATTRSENGFGATLQASYGFNAAASEMEQAYRDLLEAERVTVSVDVPVWQWGAGRAAVRAAETERDGVEIAGRMTTDRVALEARFAALDVAQARRGLALAATADTVAQRRYDIAYNRYVIGRIAVDNLYLAQSEKDQARTAYVQALSRYWQAYYRLRRLTLFDFERGVPIAPPDR